VAVHSLQGLIPARGVLPGQRIEWFKMKWLVPSRQVVSAWRGRPGLILKNPQVADFGCDRLAAETPFSRFIKYPSDCQATVNVQCLTEALTEAMGQGVKGE